MLTFALYSDCILDLDLVVLGLKSKFFCFSLVLHVLWQVSFGCWVTWLIYPKLTKVIQECLLSQCCVMGSRTLNYTKKIIWHLAIWQNFWSILSFNSAFSVFLVRGKSEKIESIYFVESSGLSCWETEKEVLLPITQLGKEDTHIILLSAWDRSCDSTAKKNLSKDM